LAAQRFTELGVDPAIAAELERQGIGVPFPIQRLTIPDALAGRDIGGKARTGSGKTLAFSVPLVQRIEPGAAKRPTGLVLVPTRELARQVEEVVSPLAAVRGLKSEAFYGGTSISHQIGALKSRVDIAIATPGRLLDLLERGAAELDDARIVVLDEADRMCDMGFMPQVERILGHVRAREQTMLFSATLDGAVDVLVRTYLRDPVFYDAETEAVDQDTDMSHRFLRVEMIDKPRVVAAIAAGASKPLVFTRTKRGADELVDNLRNLGIRAAAIHGDRAQDRREKALDDFAEGRLPLLVATDVAARGLHIEGIDVVVHYDPPQDPKAYVHRSGRTARAGEQGVVVTLITPDQTFDLWILQRELGVRIEPEVVTPDDPRLATLASGAAAPS